MSAVRLDPFQNIVNVSWGNAGSGQPPPGELKSPQLWDWMTVKAIFGGEGDSVTLKAYDPFFFENPQVGDLLLAQVTADPRQVPALSKPYPTVGITGPATWGQLWQTALDDANPANGSQMTDSLWWHFLQPGEVGADWTWSFNVANYFTGTVYRVIGAWPDAVPFPDAEWSGKREGETGVVAVQSITVSRANALLLAFVGCNSRFNLSGIFPFDPAGSGSYTARNWVEGFGSTDGIGQVVFDAEDEPAGATGARNLSISTSRDAVMGHLAILGQPA